MEPDEISAAIEKHVRTFFAGHIVKEFTWTLGPIQSALPRFRVLRVSPKTESDLWIYVSVGAWEASVDDVSKLEFMIFAPYESPRHVEQLAMTAYYHRNHDLGPGHTFPIGEPWLEGSQCDHMLVSLPYPFGQDLEICEVNDDHVHLYWLLPITTNEREFKAQNGLEALEQLFEKRGLEYWRPDRKSIV
jgi:Suppressor of fused protein (SUFU)